MSEFTGIIKKLNEHYEDVQQKGTGEAYSRLSTIFEELHNHFREHIQELTVDEVQRVVGKLKRGEHITPEDKQQIKLWIVGDAEHYANLENNFADWQSELKRLMSVIGGFNTAKPSVEEISDLRGLLRDGERVIADIMYFLQQKDRVKNFEESTEEIDDQEREFLIRLLENKIKSPDF